MTTIQRSLSAQNLKISQQKANNKCVCEICTCGKHHCPKPHVSFNVESTMHHDYKPHKISMQKQLKCPLEVNHDRYEPQFIKSTYHVDYKPFRCQTSPTFHKKETYIPNISKFMGESEYRNRFAGNKILTQQPIKYKDYFQPNLAKFEGVTTYNSQYKAKHVKYEPLKKHFKQERKFQHFDGKTIYKQSYKNLPARIERVKNPDQDKYVPNIAHFEGKTNYRQEYKAYPIQKQKQKKCLIESLPNRPRECSPGKFHIKYSASQNRWN